LTERDITFVRVEKGKKRILMYLKWKKCDEAAIRVKLPTESETA